MKFSPHQTPPTIPTEERGPGRFKKLIVPILLAVGVILVAWLGKGWWDSLSAWIETSGSLGYLIFFLSFLVLTTFCFPVSVLGFSAGAIFGPWVGLLLLFCSGLASGALMFSLGRFLFRDRIQKWISSRPKLAALDQLAAQRVVRLNILTRLSPLNYGVACYTLASGKSPFPAYLVGLVAILPSMAAQVWAGSVAAAAKDVAGGTSQHSNLEWGLLIGGLIFFALLSWQIGRLVHTAMKETAPAETTSGNLDNQQDNDTKKD